MPPTDPFAAPVAMPAPFLPPPVTPEEVRESRHEQASAPIKGLVVSAAAAVPGVALMHGEGIGVAGLKLASKYGGGVAIEHTPTGPRPIIGKVSFATFLAPAPVGIVPPELMQVQPSWLRRAIGTDLPGQETAGIKASTVRERVFEAERAERAIIHLVLFDQSLTGNRRDLSGVSTANLEAMRAFLRSTSTTQFRSPLALNALNAELAGRPNLALPLTGTEVTRVPSATDTRDDPFGAPVLTGSTQPELFKPTNALALAIQAAAKWLRKELLSERADP